MRVPEAAASDDSDGVSGWSVRNCPNGWTSGRGHPLIRAVGERPESLGCCLQKARAMNTTNHEYRRRSRLRFVAGGLTTLGVGVALQACSLGWNVLPEETTPPPDDMTGFADGDADVSLYRGVEPTSRRVEVATDAKDGGRRFTSDPTDGGADADADANDADADAACQSVACRCDNDGDGFYALTRPGCEDAGGLDDCDDDDARVRPNQSFLELASPARGGDWNCSHVVEKAYPTNVSCGLLALGACAGVQGFTGDPACGEESSFITCEVKVLIGCGTASTTTRKQACK